MSGFDSHTYGWIVNARAFYKPWAAAFDKAGTITVAKREFRCLGFSRAFSHSERGSQALSVAHLGGAFGRRIWEAHLGGAFGRLIHKTNPNRST